MSNKKLMIVIPSYEPDGKLIELVDKLNNFFTNFNIIIVNYVSVGYDNIFNEVKNKNNVILLNHKENQGKGEALKTAFKFIKKLDQESVIVTCDSDGQHTPTDIKKVYDFYLKNPNSLVLGSRKFEGNVPKKSQFGNITTKILLREVEGFYLHDSQTGLRAFGSEELDRMISIKGHRFEYEMNMLVEMNRFGVDIKEIAIETIYFDNNSNTHFRPIKDFLKICFTIDKYNLPLYLSYLLTIIVFIITYFITKAIGIYDDSLISNIYLLIMSGSIAIFFNLLINTSGFFYGNRFIFMNKYLGLRNLIITMISLIFLTGFFLLFNKYLEYKILSIILACISARIIQGLINFFVIKKKKLYEE